MIELADLISVIPLSYFFSIFYNLVIDFEVKDIIFLSGLVFTTVSTELIKKLPYPKYLNSFIMRPKGARDCDYFSKNGLVPENTPGFPSGHMSSTVFFSTYIVLNFMKKNNLSLKKILVYKPRLILINIILIIMMAWARYYKKCHNITQIIGGTIYGLGLGFLFFNINNFI